MHDVTDIPRPEVLDPDRIVSGEHETASPDEERQRAARLEIALRESCEYGATLWTELSRLRGYLVDCLPAPALNGASLGGAAPHGADDDPGWQAWTEAYASTLAALAGPRGDSGFAWDEARRIVRARLEFAADQQPTSETIRAAAPHESDGSSRTAPDWPGAIRRVPNAVSQAAALVAGLAVGWFGGRRRSAGRAG
jgi:hypothetical protein